MRRGGEGWSKTGKTGCPGVVNGRKKAGLVR